MLWILFASLFILISYTIRSYRPQWKGNKVVVKGLGFNLIIPVKAVPGHKEVKVVCENGDFPVLINRKGGYTYIAGLPEKPNRVGVDFISVDIDGSDIIFKTHDHINLSKFYSKDAAEQQ